MEDKNQIKIGSIINEKYKIEELIGTGGMSNVYKAVNIYNRKYVAIKVIKPELADNAEFLRRFRSEAQAVLNLEHENIVNLIDVGFTEDCSFIILEYVKGSTLKQLIKESAPMSEKRIIQIGQEMCEALAHAHECNIVHRDVKPHNIMINERGRAKLSDFGIAKFTTSSTLTYQGGNVLGSVHYISPEQAKGEAVSEQSDIYSLGIVIYEMATGKMPFDNELAVSVAMMQIQDKIIAPKEINPNVSVALNAVIIKATQKDLADRYKNMREFKRDLSRVFREPNKDFTHYEPKSTSDQKNHRKGPFKNITSLIVGSAIFVGVIAGFFLFGKAILDGSKTIENEYIPKLIGKSEIEGQDVAERYGFKMQVKSRISNERIPDGIIFNQEPKTGNIANKGSVVYVDISAGAAYVEMPLISGINLVEAEKILQDWGLSISEINHEYSDFPEGYVLRQLPLEGSPVDKSDIIEIWVSGEEDNMERVLSVINKSIEESLQLLLTSGFDNIWIRQVEPQSGVVSGTVINQLPKGDEKARRDAKIELWITRLVNAGYYFDVAMNLNVTKDGSKIMIEFNKDDALEHYVMYEGERSAGKQNIPLTIESLTPGEGTLIAYIDGEEVRRERIKLAKR